MKRKMEGGEPAKTALIQGALDGLYSVGEAAQKLGLSRRQVQRLKKAFKKHGELAFIHGNTGRHPSNYRDDELKARIAALKNSETYADMSFTRFRKLLAEQEGIRISYGSLVALLKAAGIRPPRKYRNEVKQDNGRGRKGSFGELLQAGAASFDWFGFGAFDSLHGFFDNATGRITALYLCETECFAGFMEVLRQTLITYGIPLELRAGTPPDETRFGAIAGERLGITLTLQDKGSNERFWKTLQDRLPLWFRLKGVTDREKANWFLPYFIAEYNARFAIIEESSDSAFVSLMPDDDLDKLLGSSSNR